MHLKMQIVLISKVISAKSMKRAKIIISNFPTKSLFISKGFLKQEVKLKINKWIVQQ